MPKQYKDGSAYVTNQGTSKSLKLQTIISVAAICLGVILIISAPSGEPSPFGALLVAGGIIYYLCLRFATWWKHG